MLIMFLDICYCHQDPDIYLLSSAVAYPGVDHVQEKTGFIFNSESLDLFT